MFKIKGLFIIGNPDKISKPPRAQNINNVMLKHPLPTFLFHNTMSMTNKKPTQFSQYPRLIQQSAKPTVRPCVAVSVKAGYTGPKPTCKPLILP